MKQFGICGANVCEDLMQGQPNVDTIHKEQCGKVWMHEVHLESGI